MIGWKAGSALHWLPESLEVAGGCVDRGFGNHHGVVGDHGDGDGDTKRTSLAAP